MDVRTVRRYIMHLQDVGIPVESNIGRYGGYRLEEFEQIPILHALSGATSYLSVEVREPPEERSDPIVVSPDTGFAKRARRYASYLGTSIAIADKGRVGHTEQAEVLQKKDQQIFNLARDGAMEDLLTIKSKAIE